jgi:hypothetical protein
MQVETQCAEYRIEISGWDFENKFFVENTALRWNEQAKKAVVHRRVAPGSMIFVRLAEALDARTSSPVPYEAVSVNGRSDAKEEYEIALGEWQMWTRVNDDQKTSDGGAR